MTTRAEIRGLKELQANLEQLAKDLHGPPIVEAVRDSALLVERDAKKGLVGYQDPFVGGVDTGRLRASITPVIEVHGTTVMGVVGTNVQYGPYVEYGTKPHWPPIAALELWARRHHTTAYIVARAISKRGTVGKYFLQGGFESNRAKIVLIIERAVSGVVTKANK